MLSKSFIASIFLLASISSVNAHAGVSPALGVKAQLTRNDVQRPSTNTPCGNVNIAQTLDSSTPVQADENGNFSPTITNFNGGADGSRSIQKVQVDASGTGKNFIAAKMIVNGNGNPTNDDSEKLTAQLPPGTKCAGGTNKNLCLASFTTTSGFGNCVVVSQGAGGASNASASPSTSGQSKSFPSGAAKGVNRSTVSRVASDNQTREEGGNKKDGEKKKGDKKVKDDEKGKGKDDKKGKGKDKKGKVDKTKNDQKNGGKKTGDKKKVKQAGEAPTSADGNNRKRSWSSRQMGEFA